jgi:uncharacterized protein (TIGR02391 family)
MRELASVIPDSNVLLAIEPEEMGGKILFLLRKRLQSAPNNSQFLLSNLLQELWQRSYVPGDTTAYPAVKQNEIDLAIAEAWAWLVAQGLLVAKPQAGGLDWYVLSRRALRFQNEAEVATFAVTRMLPKEALHPRLADKVWSAYIRSEFDVAVFQAFKTVEVAVREAATLPDDLIGVDLMRKVFSPRDGSLADMQAGGGEKQARMDLFAGAIGSYKNPHSHRDVKVDSPQEAIELIMMANHLLRIVDARRSSIT